MKQTDANLIRFSNALVHPLSAAEQEALLDNQHLLNPIKSGADTEGRIPDNKGVVQGMGNDYKKITGKDLFKTTLLIWLMLGCLITQTVWNGYRGLDSGINTKVSVIPPLIDEKITTSNVESKNNPAYHHSIKENNMETQYTSAPLSNSGWLEKYPDTLANNVVTGALSFRFAKQATADIYIVLCYSGHSNHTRWIAGESGSALTLPPSSTLPAINILNYRNLFYLSDISSGLPFQPGGDSLIKFPEIKYPAIYYQKEVDFLHAGVDTSHAHLFPLK